MPAIKILLADDHAVVAESLGILLDTLANVEVVGTVHNGWQVLTFLEVNEVNILIADLHMPLLNGIDTAIRVRERFPKVKILMLTMSEDAQLIREAVQAGVDGYVMKRAEKKELDTAIRTVMAGQRHFSEAVLARLAEIPNDNNPSGKATLQDITPLTKREIGILRMIVQERSNQEIADQLCLALSTVETHRKNILKKVGVSNALGLLKYAIKHQLLSENT